MPRFLFWNYRYGGQDREALLARLVHEEAVDVLILTESSSDPIRLADRLSSNGRSYRAMPVSHSLIQAFAGYPTETFRWARLHDRLCILGFQAPGHPEIILAIVHLIDGVNHDRSERNSKASSHARAVRAVQVEHNHARIVVVGDFNLKPFDDGMIFTEGFGAMMTKSLVKKYARSKENRFLRLYNPIWSRLGREWNDGPPGTYYWNKHRDANLYWNYIDQILVGHDLLDGFPDSQFRILTSIPTDDGPRELIRETVRHWKVEISDHLPLLFDLDLPPGAGS